ncbi:MAG: hypothetical protein ACTSU0_08180 [Alphaproteobacteria bacterium]
MTTLQPPPLPDPVRPLIGFVRYIRQHGFTVAPEQITSFLTAIRLLGPDHPDQIRLAGHATLAPPAESRHRFDELYRGYFFGEANPPTEPRVKSNIDPTTRPGGEDLEPLQVSRANKSGQVASGASMSSLRHFSPHIDDAALRRLVGTVVRRLPTRRRLRFTAAADG